MERCIVVLNILISVRENCSRKRLCVISKDVGVSCAVQICVQIYQVAQCIPDNIPHTIILPLPPWKIIVRQKGSMYSCCLQYILTPPRTWWSKIRDSLDKGCFQSSNNQLRPSFAYNRCFFKGFQWYQSHYWWSPAIRDHHLQSPSVCTLGYVCYLPAFIFAVISRAIDVLFLWTKRATRLSPLPFPSLFVPEWFLSRKVFILNGYSLNIPR